MSVRVVVADDQPLVRAGLGGIIATASDLSLVGEAATGAEAIEQVQRHRPDVVLMDIRMPGLNGIDATAAITANSAARVVMLTTFDVDEYVYAALRAGASGFLLKDTPPSDLLTAIRVVAAGDALLAPAITRRLITRFAAPPSTINGSTSRPAGLSTGPDFQERLTDREREVLILIAEGLSNREIATRLHVTAGTVKTHVTHILTKLDARDRVQLVILAFRTGLIS
ncbi:MAG TPA: response regulator transcription factor [Kineosporiaceae bacterium]|nr:response regulator transcription factor [Kineosporiaceae bacterium]